jgi:AraC-like DNA-binding protein
VPASSLFRRCWPISREDEPQALAAEVEAYLIALQPRHDSLSLKASEIAQIAEDNLDLSSVASLADRLGLSQRSVQEICHRGLGIHPKWLIRCFRLQDAALRLEAEANVSLSGLAQALGYFDQAHFTRDFKRATGVNPGHYRLCIGAGAEAPA